MKKNGTLVVISGPSGVGKSTLIKKVRETLTDLQFSVSCTTRSPREGEVDGKDYYFLTENEFASKLADGGFLEHATVFKHSYGTLRSEVSRRVQQGGQVVLDIDVQGAKQIRQAAANDPLIAAAAHFIIIVPPDPETLKQRLRGRNSETPEQLELRLNGAVSELENFRIYDYVIVNGDLETAAADLTGVLKSIRLRTANITGGLFDEQ